MNLPETYAELVAIVLQAEREALVDAYDGRNNCVGATAAAVDAYSRLGVMARPMAVRAELLLPGRHLTIGFSGAGLPDGEHDLHLICVVDGGALLDLSLDQARLHEGFSADSLFIDYANVAPEFWSVGGTTSSGLGTGVVTYTNHEDARDYEDSSHWLDDRARKEIVDRVVRRAEPLRPLYTESHPPDAHED